MRDSVKTLNYRGFTIEIWQDDNSHNPREDWDNVDTMVCWHGGYNLGDKHSYDDTEDFLWDIAEMNNRLGNRFYREYFNWDGVDAK